MPIQVHRDEIYPTAIVLTFSAKWTMVEMYEAWEKAFSMRDETSEPVHYIYDCRNFNRFPPGILSAISYVGKNVNPENLNIILGGSGVVATVARLFGKVSYSITVIFVKTPEEVHKLLEEHGVSSVK